MRPVAVGVVSVGETGMRILVVDDHLNFELALRGILDGHTVRGVRDPDTLPSMLAHEEPFDQAVVDLRFPQSSSTGLTALARLRALSPATRTIVTTTDEEENRLLYLLAAFQFFEPKALLAKRATPLVTRAIVEAVGHGEAVPSAAADPFRDAARMQPPLLDQVVRSQTELGIWQALVRFDKRPEIANAAHVHPRTLDTFTAAKKAVIDIINDRFPQLERGPDPSADREPTAGYRTGRTAPAHHNNLIEVIHFARTHLQFFTDAEAAGLLSAHWRPR
jgi:DNA-binding NarL/FixJ family response regulator